MKDVTVAGERFSSHSSVPVAEDTIDRGSAETPTLLHKYIARKWLLDVLV